MSITNGSEYKEIDTGNTYSYDAEGSSWYLNNTTTSGEGSGANGIAPHIGENGNWFIGSTDTGVSAEGENGGYYIPAVSQPSSDKLQISFAPSKPDMPAVNTVTVNLPVSENSGQNVAQVEPADGDTPLVFFTGVKPTTKDNVLAEMVYISKGKIIKAFVKIKCQGSSSMSYAKKNFTVTLYQDEARTIPLYLEFKDWGIKVNKFVLKADWIDHSHARNVCTARIWKDIVESRPDYDALPEELRNAPGHGAIVGFPIAVYYNGNYEGLYNWNIGKDPWMWGMDENNPNHAMLCAEVNNEGKGTATMCNFQGPLWGGVDGTGWSVEIGTNSQALKNSLNSLISFVANSDGETFVNGIEEYLDVQSAMDYYCLCYADCGLDGLGKNMTIGTYDGRKWYFGAYDLDCTWLLYWNGSKFVPANYRCPEDYQENANLLFDKFERYMTERLKANYFRLRKGPLSEANVLPHFERYIGAIASERYADDLNAYPGIPQGYTNNIRQIRTAVRDRFAFTDTEFAAMAVPVPCTGITLDKNALTFTAAGTQTLTATVTPGGCTDPVIWESDNTRIATVVDGVVTAAANGSATITAKCGGYSANCAVSVSGVAESVPCTGITLNKTALSFSVAEMQTLTAAVEPENTTDPVIWASDNTSVATVSGGVVTAVAAGNATITAKCGDYSATCTAEVREMGDADNLLNGAQWTDTPAYNIVNGVISSGDQYVTQELIPAEEGVAYALSNTNGGTFTYKGLYYYDADGNYLSAVGTDVSVMRHLSASPAGTAYLRAAGHPGKANYSNEPWMMALRKLTGEDNLLRDAKWVADSKVDTSNGEITTNVGTSATSGFIEIDSGAQYGIMNTNGSAFTYLEFYFYDANGAYLSMKGSTNKVVPVYLVTAPTNAAKARIQVNHNGQANPPLTDAFVAKRF